MSKVCFKSAIIETDRPADIFMVTISLLRSDCMCRTGLYGLNNSNRDMSLKNIGERISLQPLFQCR